MENWMIVTFDFDGVTVAGIIQEFDYDYDIHTDVLPGQRFTDDSTADNACFAYSLQANIPVFGNLAPAANACPCCGNRNIETLEILDLPDDTSGTWDLVECLICNTQYKI
jgi:hypothetical protein